MNLLVNPSFDGSVSHYKGNPEVDVPAGWDVGWLDNKYGPRRREGVVKCYKPEVRRIELVPPHDDPPRVAPYSVASLHGYKSWGTLCWWVYHKVIAAPGKTYRFGAVAHAWAHESGDPDGGHYTHGIGTAAYYATEDVPGLSDDVINYRFRVGIDPFGGSDPFGSAVIWGLGAYIYNMFHSIPLVEAMARADYITVFLMIDNLWGFENSDAYIDNAELVAIDVPPPVECHGLPRVQYARKYHVIPATTTPKRLAEIRAIVPFTDTSGSSYDDAGVGDLADKTAVLWDIPPERHTEFVDWFNEWYPGTKVEFVQDEQPPIPPPVRHISLGGVHVMQGDKEYYADYLRILAEAGRPVGLVKTMEDGGLLEAKSASPETITIWRNSIDDDDFPSVNWYFQSSLDCRLSAEWWLSQCYPIWAQNPADYYEVINEPNEANDEQLRWLTEWLGYAMIDANQHGYKLGIGGFSSGCPSEPHMDYMLDLMAECAATGNILCVHDGATQDPLTFRGSFPGSALRYRIWKAKADAMGKAFPLVAITECYAYGNMADPEYWNDWAWYLTEMRKDAYCLGAAWFTIGQFGSVNFSGKPLEKYTQMQIALPMVIES